MLPFTRLVQSEMPFLAPGRTVPVQVEGVSPLVAELCCRAGDGGGRGGCVPPAWAPWPTGGFSTGPADSHGRERGRAFLGHLAQQG